MRGKLATAAAALILAMGPAVAFAAETTADAYYSKTYTTCMDAAGGSTLPMRDCQNAEYAAWDKALNVIYDLAIAGRLPPDKLKLRDEQRVWLKHTKARCEHAGDDEAGGSLQGVEVQGCYLDATILRTVYLRGVR